MKTPIGATWKAVCPVSGDTATVWLDRRHDNGREVWFWSFRHKDGSGARQDWTPTRRLAVEEARICFAYTRRKPPRFARVQPSTNE